MIVHLTSQEPYLIDLEVKKILKESNINKGDLDYLETKEVEKLEPFIQTYSLFAPKKVAIITESEDEKLIKLFEKLSDDIIIILPTPIDKRKKLYKWLSKNKFIQDIPVYKKLDLISWIKDLGNEFNCKLTNEVANQILSLTGEKDMYNIRQEVYKVSCMNTKVTKELVNQVVSKTSLVISFDLTDAIIKKDIEKALIILNELIEKNETMIPIVALLNKNFSVIRSLKEVNDTILKEIGIDFYTLKNLRPYAKGNLYTNNELDQYIKLTEQADFDCKNGLEEKLIMEKLILSMSTKGI